MIKQLEDWLSNEFWNIGEIHCFLAGYIPVKEPGSRPDFTNFIDITDGKLVKFNPSNETEFKARRRYIKNMWERPEHDFWGDRDNFDFSGGRNTVLAEYVILWALHERIDLPWLEEAIEAGLVANKIGYSISKKTTKSDPITPRFEYAPLTTNFGYFPALEVILKDAYQAGEGKPNPRQVFEQLVEMKPKDVKFDEEKKTLSYITQEGEWTARPTTLRGLKEAISKRAKKL